MRSLLRRARTPEAGVVAVTVGLLAIVFGNAGLWGGSPVSESITIPWWMFAIAFALAERVVLHVQVRREAQTMSVSELPLVFGLFFANPLQLLIGRLVGSALVFVVHRRSRPLKTMFNLALVGAETTIAIAVFWAIAPAAQDGSPRAWIAAFAGATVANVIGAIAVGLVIGMYDGSMQIGEILRSALFGQPATPAVITLALVGVTSLTQAGASWVLVVGVTVFLLLGYRAYATLSDRHLDLERLYSFSQVASRSPEVDDILVRTLGEARVLLHAERAEVTFVSGQRGTTAARLTLSADAEELHRAELDDSNQEERWLRETVIDDQAALIARLDSDDPDVVQWLRSRGLREAIAVPLTGTAGPIGVLTVGDRMGEVRRFNDQDVNVLETIANQASLALQNGELVDRMQHDALHDELTGLPNRHQLQQVLHDRLAAVGPGSAHGVTLMILDLNGFKDVNDTLGHEIGDQLLVEIAQRLRSVAEPQGFVARLGGDEFAIVTQQHDQPAANRAAKAIHDALTAPIQLAGLDLVVAGALGIAMTAAGRTDASALLKQADTAMYRAKSHGRGICFYEDRGDTNSPRRLLIGGELRQALTTRQIVPHFQPQASLRDDNVVAVEALARWTHPDLGRIGPDEFIPIAERSGLIDTLTTSVLDSALDACAAWLRSGLRLPVSVNVSARSLLDAEIVTTAARLLDRHQLGADLLTIEITESAVMTDPARALEVLESLHSLGVRLSVDDFGTGYSSLSYLQRLPIHEIKIDRGFVKELRTPTSRSIVQTIIDLGRNLELQVVAEGCEDQWTADTLRSMGCDLVQGWHLAAAMPAIELAVFVERRQQMSTNPAVIRG